MRRVVLAGLTAILPSLAAAQSTELTPSFAATETYDGNLFASANDPQGSLVHSFGPRLKLDRRNAVSSITGRYELDAQYVQELPEDGLILSRNFAALALGTEATRRLTLDAEVEYLDTRAPADLRSVTSIDRGRLRTRRVSARPTASYAFTRRTKGSLGYAFVRDVLPDATADEHDADAQLDYRVSRRDTASARLLLREIVFEGETRAPSEVVMLGWARELSRATTASLRAGPRFRAEALDGLEAAAALRHRVDDTELEASYTRAETTVLGLEGSFETDAALVAATWAQKPSAVRASAGVARTHGRGERADVAHTEVAASTALHPWLTAELSLQLSWQHLDPPTAFSAVDAPAAGDAGTIFHPLLALTLVVAPPEPLPL